MQFQTARSKSSHDVEGFSGGDVSLFFVAGDDDSLSVDGRRDWMTVGRRA